MTVTAATAPILTADAAVLSPVTAGAAYRPPAGEERRIPGVDDVGPVQPLDVPRQQLDDTQRRADQLRARGLTGDDPTTQPSFLHKALEIFEFIIRCLPVVGQIANLISAVIAIGRLAYALISGEHKEQIDWTKELSRIAGHLMGVAFPFAGALSNAILNYWFDAMSENRQGVQMFGGINYYLGDDEFGRQRRGVVRETIDGTRRLVSGMFTPTQPVAPDPSLANPALQPGLDVPVVSGGPLPQGRALAPARVQTFAPRAE